MKEFQEKSTWVSAMFELARVWTIGMTRRFDFGRSALNFTDHTRFLFYTCLFFLAKRRAKWVYNLVACEARSQCENRAWVLASCKLAALIFTCTYPMVSAMTSYSSLTSRRIFVSRQHWTESDFEFPSMIKYMYSWRAVFSSSAKQCLLAIFHANRTANTRTPNCQSSQGKIWHRKILWSENANLKFNGSSNKDGWRQQQQTAEQREHHSMNFKC